MPRARSRKRFPAGPSKVIAETAPEIDESTFAIRVAVERSVEASARIPAGSPTTSGSQTRARHESAYLPAGR